jgi:YegS/Rv2252/BmrU family lipid kinase
VAARTTVILNPVSANGATARDWARIERRLQAEIGGFEVAVTEKRGDATTFARRAVEDGVERVLVVGGDGTLNEAVNGYLDGDGAPRNPAAAIGFIPHGTGDDFRRSISLPQCLPAQVSAIKAGRVRSIDVGRVTFLGNDGHETVRHFVNVATVGLGGRVARKINRGGWIKRLGGKAAFYWATLSSVATYTSPAMRVVVDDGFDIEERTAVVAVCNGRWCGGGMKMAPDAEIDDGEFDIVVIERLNMLTAIRDIRLIYGGRHLDHPLVSVARGRRVRITGTVEADLDVDGEAPGFLPATFEVVPRALRLIA